MSQGWKERVGDMRWLDDLRRGFGDAIGSADDAVGAVDSLCLACVNLLDVEWASVSLIHDGVMSGTFGASDAKARELDELQLAFGEGPCLDAVHLGTPVLAPDLASASEQRWPTLRSGLLERGVGSVIALPIAIASSPVGAVDLFRTTPGVLADAQFAGGLIAAELAVAPLLDLMAAELDIDVSRSWTGLESLERVEVYQATGMIMGAIGVSTAEAVIRLRAYAFTQGITVSAAAVLVVERRLIPDPVVGWRHKPSRPEGQ